MGKASFKRQLATVVCIDAVGFSRMMGLDDEAALSAFEERRALIDAICGYFGGRMFGAAGDSMMSEFGSPVDALRAVFAFQEKIDLLNREAPNERHMAFRAGINTGDVIVRGEFLFGDDVNIAARLQELATGGGVVISGTTYEHVKGKSAARFTYLGDKVLKNIILPVSAFACSRGGDAGSLVETEPDAIGIREMKRDPSPGPPAIAVLPFRNVANDPEMDFVADGIAGDIATGLANVRWLPVISRGSTFQFRDERLDAVSAGRTLGAGYVVSGSIVRDGSRIRLNATLEDVPAARVIWTRRFDHEFSNILDLQDELGAQIISILEGQVERAEQARTFQIPWEDLETWQLVRRGRWHMNRRSSEDTRRALECYEKALENDPNSSTVLGEIAWWYFWRAWIRRGDRVDLDHVEKYARKALYMDSQDARLHAYLGACEIMRRNLSGAIPHFEESLRINPSYAFAHSGMGSSKLLLGNAAQSIPNFEQAERLSPFDIYLFHNLGELASAQFHVGNWNAASAIADRSLSLSPGYFLASIVKIGALANAGQSAKARAELEIFRHRHPDFKIGRVEWIPYVKPEFNRRMIEAFESVAALQP